MTKDEKEIRRNYALSNMLKKAGIMPKPVATLAFLDLCFISGVMLIESLGWKV